MLLHNSRRQNIPLTHPLYKPVISEPRHSLSEIDALSTPGGKTFIIASHLNWRIWGEYNVTQIVNVYGTRISNVYGKPNWCVQFIVHGDC